MPKRTPRENLSVNKSFSLPFPVLEAILDEAEIMGKSASEAVVILVRIGLSQRNIMRKSEDENNKKV